MHAFDPCAWDHPGANPYRGDPIVAVADYPMAPATRAALVDQMRQHQYVTIATITRDDIDGYENMRDMHSGHGVMCHGVVDRRAWRAADVQRGLVYCSADVCVIVPTICNNVSLVDRKPVAGVARPEEVAALVLPPVDVPSAILPPTTVDLGDLTTVEAPSAGQEGPIPAFFPVTWYVGGPMVVIAPRPPASGASSPSHPVTPIGPVTPLPPISAVREPMPTWLMVCGLVAVLLGKRRQR
jgi:hypothetical protein